MTGTLDLSRPVALMLVAVLHFLPDADDPARLVATLLGALAPGSYLVASHVTPEHDREGVSGLERTYRQGGIPAQARTAAEFAALAFRGLEMIDPGVVLVSEWRRPAGPRPLPAEVNWHGGIRRKTVRISASVGAPAVQGAGAHTERSGRRRPWPVLSRSSRQYCACPRRCAIPRRQA